MTLFLLKGGAALFLMVSSAVLSLGETGLMSLSRLQLWRLAREHPGRLDFWQRDPDRALAVILFLNTFVNTGLAVLSVSLALDAAEYGGVPFRWGRVVFPGVGGVLVLLFCEVGPKVAARRNPEALALALAPMLGFLTRGGGPLLEGLLQRVGRLLSWLSRTVRTERAQWDRRMIRALLDKALLGLPLRQVLKNVVGFAQRPVASVMVPREEMATVDLRSGLEGAIRQILSSGYSRLPVHRGSVDDIEGMVYSKDLLAPLRSRSLITLEDLVRPLPRVFPEVPLARLLRDFREGHHHMVLVAEGGGRVLGLVTLQDTLEAIVGDIAKEPRLIQ